jgi:hypothetical protein
MGVGGLSHAHARGSFAGLLVSAITLPFLAVPMKAAGGFAAGPSFQPARASSLVASSQPGPGGQPTAQGGSSLSLILRRQPGGVEVVIEGTGATPMLQQGRNGNSWAPAN